MQMVRISLRHAAGLRHEGHERLGKVSDRRGRLDPVKATPDLGARLSGELSEQEVDRPLGSRLAREVVAARAAGEEALLVGGAELPSLRQRRGKPRHAWEGIAHSCDVDRSRHDVGLPGGVDPGVLRVYRRDGGDPPLYSGSHEGPARIAVTARAERRACDQHVGPLLLEELEQPGERFLLVLGEVIVAATDRRRDLDPLRRQSTAGPDRAFEPRRRRLGLVLAPDPREELVQVVDGLHELLAPSVS
jgi:hypothetical protein